MTEREKVIKALKCCVSVPFCEGCPWEECEHQYNTVDNVCIPSGLVFSAISLLERQEPRVLTLDDVCGGGECWIEYKYGGCGYADVYLSDHPDGTAQVYRCRPVGDTKPETVWLNDYGRFWRGWTSRPTDEQRKAVAWDA